MLENNTVNLETAVSPTTLEFKRADQHDTEENVFLKKKKKGKGRKISLKVLLFLLSIIPRLLLDKKKAPQ